MNPPIRPMVHSARENPFRSERILRAIRFRFLDADWKTFLDRCANSGWRGAIVGPEGSGKTTLLEDLEHRLRMDGIDTVWFRGSSHAPWLRKRAWQLLFSPRVKNRVILLDGCESIPFPIWVLIRLLAIRAKGLIATLHRPGRMRTLHHARTTPALLAEIASKLANGPLPDATKRFLRHGGNLRTALRELYDEAAGIAGSAAHTSEAIRS